jgi:uncharacterized membrane protein
VAGTVAGPSSASTRIAAIDWMRGLVMILMIVISAFAEWAT